MSRRKWEIEKLKYNKQLKRSADMILKDRINGLLKFIEKYFKRSTVENLHDVRIALRRVRYSMELFITCYHKNIFIRFYNKIQNLQDISGAVRDVDVSIENINSIVKEGNIKIDAIIFEKAKTKKISLEEKFIFDLAKFISGKVLKDFYKQIS
jgi:CHAD domain-containing protein